jgi:hypothetical protein
VCRNIRPLNNFDPPATPEEIHDAALQYVRKIAGSTRPSSVNSEAYDEATLAIAEATQRLIDSLVTNQPSKNREIEAEKRKLKSAARFSTN